MDFACYNKVCTLLFVEAVKIRNVLEVVCIKFTGFYYKVGLYIIIKFNNFKFVTVIFKDLAYACVLGVTESVLLIVVVGAGETYAFGNRNKNGFVTIQSLLYVLKILIGREGCLGKINKVGSRFSVCP